MTLPRTNLKQMKQNKGPTFKAIMHSQRRTENEKGFPTN
jgi:hypothetical protein